MTENEAIRVLKDFDAQVTAKADGAYQTNIGKMACDAAIKALEDVQQYRALEKHLSDMFGGSLSLKMCVDELERILVEPDSPHPMNAKILTYQEAADWEAYREIGTSEECRKSVDICKAMAERRLSLENIENYMKFEDECVKRGFTFNSLLEAREKQEPKEPTDRCMYKECPACGEVEIQFCKYCPSCGQKLDWRNEE